MFMGVIIIIKIKCLFLNMYSISFATVELL